MSDILDLIDGALQDYETSGDAMRWAPEPPAKAGARDPRAVFDEIDHVSVSPTRIEINGIDLGPYVAGPIRLTGEWDMPSSTPNASERIQWLPTGTITVTFTPLADSHGRVPYQDLSAAEMEALHEWVRLHGLNPARVPIDPLIELDEAMREWRIEVHRLRGGKLVLAEGGAERVVVRRRWHADLPWRRA